MPLSVLITQCLQRDFVQAVGRRDRLPNRLHVGHAEALRLLGPEPADGPVARLMAWARAQKASDLRLVHVRDWHDPDDPGQRDHLATFGPHCLRGTPGAGFVFDAPPGEDGEGESIIDASGLNDFVGTTLPGLLERFREEAPDRELRVGVVGVWTEAKVSFLLYDLKTRAGVDVLATASPLTASASRTQHFNALEQAARILGVRVFDAVSDFQTWLVPESEAVLPPARRRFETRIVLPAAHPGLGEEDRDLVTYLYRDAALVELEPLSGGFSGAAVYRAESRDALGHTLSPSVLKLGPVRLVNTERVNFERVEEILGNAAPTVRGFAEIGERGGLKFAFAAMGQGRVRTFKSLFEFGAPVERLCEIARTVFEDVLGRFYRVAQKERISLLAHYGFSEELGPSVRRLVRSVAGDGEFDAGAESIRFPGGFAARNVCRFYDTFLPGLGPSRRTTDLEDFHLVSYQHGDLNGANVLIDARENVWLIDHFHTGRGPVLKDLAKFENDLLYLWTPLASEDDLAAAIRLTGALRGVTDLGDLLPEIVDGLESPSLLRSYTLLRTLRALAGEASREERDPLAHRIALLRYAVHTLAFDEASPLQKRWALAAACAHAEDVENSLTRGLSTAGTAGSAER